MKTAVKDYVVVLLPDNKKKLVQVTEVSDEIVGIVDDREKDGDHRNEVRFSRTDVLCNLGPNPHAWGQVYGLNIEPFVKSKRIRPFAGVYVFRDLLESEERSIFASLKKMGLIIQQRGLFPVKPIIVEIRPPKGKYAGSFRHFRKEEEPDLITLRPHDVEDTDYIVLHELCHAMDTHLFGPELKAEWVGAYMKSTLLNEVNKAGLSQWLTELKNAGSCTSLLSHAEEEDRLVLKEIFKFISSQHKLKKRDIDLLLATEDYNDLDSIWPTKTMQIGRKDVLVTEYSSTSVAEFIAESMTYYLLDRELPANIKKLCKRSIKSV